MIRRGQVGGAILGLWIVGLAMLGRRELFRTPSERLAMAAMRVAPVASYFAVHQDGEQIGFASTTIDTTEANIVVSDYLVADVPAGGRYQRATATTRVSLTRTLRVKDFTVRIDVATGPVEATGSVEGDSVLVLTIAAFEAAPDTQRIGLSGPVLLPTLVPLAAALLERPTIGRRYRFSIFDPLAMRASEMHMVVRAESLFVVTDSARMDRRTDRWIPALRDTIRAWELVPDTASAGRMPPMHLAWWVDELGRVVEARQAAGLRLSRTAYELAFENWRLDSRERPARPTVERDVLESTAIASDVPLERDELSRLRVRLGDVTLDGFDLDGGRQTLSGDLLEIRQENPGALVAAYRLPMADSIRFAEALREEPLVQSRERRIRRLARELAARSDDPRVVAERINRWVHRNIRKRVTVGVPSALAVLESRSGDCNEHTQLFIALARAAGIPARGAAGLALVDGKFYYHAWPEVYLGTWVAVDPTFGQFPADAAHLRFTTGGVTRQVDLLRLIGNLDITVVEASERP